MTQKSNYKVYVFDRNDKYLGTIDQAPLSRARSYDLYYKDQFVFGDYFKTRLKNKDKLKIIREIITAIETERLIRRFQRTDSKQFKILRFELPISTKGDLLKDVRLYNASGKRIKVTQISKAKYFNIYIRDISGEWHIADSREFAQVRLPVEKKIEAIKHYVKVADQIISIPPGPAEEEDTPFEYESWSTEGQSYYMRMDGTLSRSQFRKIQFTTPPPVQVMNGRLDDNLIEPLKEIITSEYEIETSTIEATINSEGQETYPSRIRVKLEYVDPITGEIKEKWVSTTRRINATVNGFIKNNLPEFWGRIAQIIETYAARENFAEVSLSRIEIETEIP